ncbi:MAG: OmpA family protein [Petrimonas sp.]|nr:OmpA family protein [Petrimonas sp.]
MTKKIYVFLLFLALVSLNAAVHSQTPYYQQGDTLVMEEYDLVNFLKKLATGVRNLNVTAGINQQHVQNPGLQANQNDLLMQYRFDKLENMLDNIMYRMGIRPATPGQNIILDRSSGGTTPLYLGNNDGVQQANINRLQRQVDLLEEQLKLLTEKTADNSLKSQMGDISKELSGLRQSLMAQNTPPAPEVIEVRRDSVIIQKDTVIVKNIREESFDNYKRQIFFGVASSKLTAEAQHTLRSVAEVMKENPGLSAQIIGYASPDGNTDFNNALSTKRADSSKNLLISYGIDAARINLRQAGEDTVSDMKTYARRADILLTK